jgi:hypothetical protein
MSTISYPPIAPHSNLPNVTPESKFLRLLSLSNGPSGPILLFVFVRPCRPSLFGLDMITVSTISAADVGGPNQFAATTNDIPSIPCFAAFNYEYESNHSKTVRSLPVIRIRIHESFFQSPILQIPDEVAVTPLPVTSSATSPSLATCGIRRTVWRWRIICWTWLKTDRSIGI